MPPVEDLCDAYGRHGGIAANVPSSLTNNRDIDSILRAADEIQDEDATISRIWTVLEQLSSEVSPEDADRLIPAELKVKGKDSQLQEIQRSISEKEERIFHLEQEVGRCRKELDDSKGPVNELLKVEASLKSDVENQKKMSLHFKREFENLLKDKEERIFHLEQEVGRCRKELDDSEGRVNELLKVEASLKSDVENQKKEKGRISGPATVCWDLKRNQTMVESLYYL